MLNRHSVIVVERSPRMRKIGTRSPVGHLELKEVVTAPLPNARQQV